MRGLVLAVGFLLISTQGWVTGNPNPYQCMGELGAPCGKLGGPFLMWSPSDCICQYGNVCVGGVCEKGSTTQSTSTTTTTTTTPTTTTTTTPTPTTTTTTPTTTITTTPTPTTTPTTIATTDNALCIGIKDVNKGSSNPQLEKLYKIHCRDKLRDGY